MITTTHAILNSALLGRKENPTHYWPVVLGSIFPDFPMVLYFLFYSLQSLHIPLTGGYLNEYRFRQLWVDWGHSIPLALVVALVCFLAKFQGGLYFSLSVLLHSLEDLPVHADYAHRHFLPLSNYRFYSPISYWDPQHHAKIVAPIEWLLVLACIGVLWRRGLRPWVQALLLFIGIFQGLWLVYFYLDMRWAI